MHCVGPLFTWLYAWNLKRNKHSDFDENHIARNEIRNNAFLFINCQFIVKCVVNLLSIRDCIQLQLVLDLAIYYL